MSTKFLSIKHGALIHPGNFEDDWGRVAKADWVFEAVVEELEVKRKLFERVAAAVKPHAIVTTNTSGLGIAAMTSHLPPGFRRRFLGTHFFNPPRYLKLLETIPGPETDPGVVHALSAFCDEVLGKGVVRAKDTPNFIANRVGSYAFGQAIRAMQELDLTIEEVDTLTGPSIGRAKSATFRTADIAGVDVCVKVWSNLYDAVPGDPEREVFRAPTRFTPASTVTPATRTTATTRRRSATPATMTAARPTAPLPASTRTRSARAPHPPAARLEGGHDDTGAKRVEVPGR